VQSITGQCTRLRHAQPAVSNSPILLVHGGADIAKPGSARGPNAPTRMRNTRLSVDCPDEALDRHRRRDDVAAPRLSHRLDMGRGACWQDKPCE
jgi:hypothetical protein